MFLSTLPHSDGVCCLQAEALNRTRVLARSLALWKEEHQLLRLAARGLRALLHRTLAAAWNAWQMLHQASLPRLTAPQDLLHALLWTVCLPEQGLEREIA